mmetsp:Transcript_11098/g.31655  ORF Transcript_11098/g.31655 Transcript_11098/m.31655 type:complete len:327 (-) Transcript_11098:823-1803(-)
MASLLTYESRIAMPTSLRVLRQSPPQRHGRPTEELLATARSEAQWRLPTWSSRDALLRKLLVRCHGRHAGALATAAGSDCQAPDCFSDVADPQPVPLDASVGAMLTSFSEEGAVRSARALEDKRPEKAANGLANNDDPLELDGVAADVGERVWLEIARQSKDGGLDRPALECAVVIDCFELSSSPHVPGKSNRGPVTAEPLEGNLGASNSTWPMLVVLIGEPPSLHWAVFLLRSSQGCSDAVTSFNLRPVSASRHRLMNSWHVWLALANAGCSTINLPTRIARCMDCASSPAKGFERQRMKYRVAPRLHRSDCVVAPFFRITSGGQ